MLLTYTHPLNLALNVIDIALAACVFRCSKIILRSRLGRMGLLVSKSGPSTDDTYKNYVTFHNNNRKPLSHFRKQKGKKKCRKDLNIQDAGREYALK